MVYYLKFQSVVQIVGFLINTLRSEWIIYRHQILVPQRTSYRLSYLKAEGGGKCGQLLRWPCQSHRTEVCQPLLLSCALGPLESLMLERLCADQETCRPLQKSRMETKKPDKMSKRAFVARDWFSLPACMTVLALKLLSDVWAVLREIWGRRISVWRQNGHRAGWWIGLWDVSLCLFFKGGCSFCDH